MNDSSTPVFPFAAIVGMEQAKRSLICHAVDPRIGGTLLLGHRGCAKSTLARAFAGLLPDSPPFIEIPLGVTEDRLLGAVDAEHLVERGGWRERTGLIESAHDGVLYVDEINLLPDSLSDHLLDAAASGRIQLQRDGLSRSAQARFILIGTMNPDEGELRPQLLDRFAHGVPISDQFSEAERIEIIRRRMEYDDDPTAFASQFLDDSETLVRRVLDSRERIRSVLISDTARASVAAHARELRLEGIRAELAVVRTARALAAWEDAGAVADSHLVEAWLLCLGHRMSDTTPPPPNKTGQPRSGATSLKPTIPLAPTSARPDPAPCGSPNLGGKPNSGLHTRISGNTSSHTAGGRSGSILWTKSWIEHLLRSAQGWRLLRRVPESRPTFWAFLDASRSCGSSGFLPDALASLLHLSQQHRRGRWTLLALQDGATRWLVRKGSARGLARALTSITHGSGKSHLAPALKKMRRAISGSSFGPSAAVICSDGMATPPPGQSAIHSRTHLRWEIARLARITQLHWLHPEPSGAAAQQWLSCLFAGTAIRQLSFLKSSGNT